MVSSQTFLCIGLQISLEILLQTGGCSWHLKFKKNITFNNRSHQGSVRFNEGFFYMIFKNSLSIISYLLFNGIAYFFGHGFTFGRGDIFGHFLFYIFTNFFFNLSTISVSGTIVFFFTCGFSYSLAILFLNLATNRI